MTAKKHSEINFTSGGYVGNLLWFTFPIMVTGILQILFNTTDSAVVGQFVDDDSLAAVSSTVSIYNMVVNFFMGLSIGSNILIAQYFGSNRQKDIEETVSTSIVLSLIVGALVSLIGVTLCRPFLLLLKTPTEVIDQAVTYLTIIFIGAPLNLLFNFSAAIMRGSGDTARPMWYLLAAVVLNVLLDYLFVGVFHMGVAGAALGTILSQGLAAVLSLIRLLRSQSGARFRIVRGEPIFYAQKFRRIFAVGVPAGIQSLLFSIANMIIQAAVNSFGNIAVAGIGAGYQVECVIYAVVQAFNHSALNFAAQNVGAGRILRVKKGILINTGLATLVGGVLGVLSYVFAEPLIRLFTDSPEAIHYGVVRILYMCLPYAIVGVMEAMAGAVRGLGAAVTPTVITLACACFLRVLWVKLIFPLKPDLEMLLICYPISQILTSAGQIIAFIFFYRRLKKRSPQPAD